MIDQRSMHKTTEVGNIHPEPGCDQNNFQRSRSMVPYLIAVFAGSSLKMFWEAYTRQLHVAHI